MDRLRRAHRASALLTALIATTLATVACTGKDLRDPGTRLGTFHVSGTLVRSSCGATPDPWQFDVRLNHEGATLHWVQGSLPISGKVDGTGHVTLRAHADDTLRPSNERTKQPACVVTRDDALDLTLHADGGAPEGDPAQAQGFAGTLSYTFTPAAASDCSDQLTAAGGDFDALPCTVSYQLAASRAAGSTP